MSWLPKDFRTLVNPHAGSLRWPVGISIVFLVILARLLGVFSWLELLAIDTFLSYRFDEGIDPYITIVGLDSDYLRNQEMASDSQLVELIEAINAHNPIVMGVNISRPPLPNDDRQSLRALFETNDHLIISEKISPPSPIRPLTGLSSETILTQVGFNDQSIDSDGRLRRIFLGAWEAPDETGAEQFRKSFSLLAAEIFLQGHGYELGNGLWDQYAMRFQKSAGSFWQPWSRKGTDIPRLTPNAGGYVRESSIEGIQTLVNFRTGPRPFHVLEASAVSQGEFEPQDFEGRIVLIGATDFLAARELPTPVTSSLFADEEGSLVSGMLGIELEAHSISQLVNAALNGRSLIRPLPLWVESWVILACGLCGILIGKISPSTIRNLCWLALATGLLMVSHYSLLVLAGIWLPVFPATTGLVAIGTTYIAFAHGERKSEKARKRSEALAETLRQERHRTIERTFGEIHAGPLQTLAGILRRVRDGDAPQSTLLRELKSLNAEIRRIGEQLRQEGIDNVYLTGNGKVRIDLMHPMHEVFYEVYNNTLARQLPGFQTIKIRLVQFDPFNAEHLDLELKRSLCWFIEESLVNVGKHAEGTTRLEVTGQLKGRFYALCVEDNGPGIRSSRTGEGTRFNYRLQSLLGGSFLRRRNSSGGTTCRFTWSVSEADRL
jgi:CHASE2 domain-containing sensor protein